MESGRINRSVVSILLVVFMVVAADAEVVVRSPNGQVSAKIWAGDGNDLMYQLDYKGMAVIEPSRLGVAVDGHDLGRDVRLGEPDRCTKDETYPWRGVHSKARNHYRGATIPIACLAIKAKLTLEVRVFDDGLAYRYIVPGNGTVTISGEATSFRIPAGSAVWYQTNTANYENFYERHAIEQVPADTYAGPPVVAELPEGKGFLAITEAALFDYSGMTLRAEDGDSRRWAAAFQDDDSWEVPPPAKSPWRVVIVTADLDGLVNSDIIHNLNDPPSADLAGADWIRPGRAFWHWWSRTIGNWDSVAYDRQFAWIDHAATFGFEHYLVDAGWEHTWKKPGKDKWDLLRELTDYAAERRASIFVWKRWKTGRTEGIEMTGLDDPDSRRDFFRRCRDAGAAGIKIDFMDSESKNLVDFYTNVLKDAARYHLMINFHGANKPTGESRTYPNEMSREGLRGLEYNKWSTLPPTHYATLPFTRLVAGHGDFTSCTFNPKMLKGTTFALQLATVICFISPITHYADRPQLYLNSPAFDVIKAIPVTWDQTLVLPGSKIGEMAVMARRKGRTWFVGIINGRGSRSYSLDLSFLGSPEYTAVQLGDGDRPDVLVRKENTVSAGRTLRVNMSAGGGFVAMFKPK